MPSMLAAAATASSCSSNVTSAAAPPLPLVAPSLSPAARYSTTSPKHAQSRRSSSSSNVGGKLRIRIVVLITMIARTQWCQLYMICVLCSSVRLRLRLFQTATTSVMPLPEDLHRFFFSSSVKPFFFFFCCCVFFSLFNKRGQKGERKSEAVKRQRFSSSILPRLLSNPVQGRREKERKVERHSGCCRGDRHLAARAVPFDRTLAKLRKVETPSSSGNKKNAFHHSRNTATKFICLKDE